MAQEKSNIHPLHLDFQNEGSTSSYSTLYNFYQLDAKGFQNFTSEGSTSSYSALKTSGFQYILSSATPCAVAENDTMTDSARIIITQNITEFMGMVDSADTRPARTTESSNLADSARIIIKQNITETMTMADSATGKGFSSAVDSSPMAESVATKVQQRIAEASNLRESVQTICRVTDKWTVYINAYVHTKIPYTVKISKKIHQTDKYSTQITGMINTLTSATASGGSNPFQPTVVINGVSLFGALPTGIGNTIVYVNVPNTATG